MPPTLIRPASKRPRLWPKPATSRSRRRASKWQPSSSSTSRRSTRPSRPPPKPRTPPLALQSIEGDPYAQSLDESLAERHQQLGRRHARLLDSGATPPADGHGQRNDPPDHRLLDQNRDGADRRSQAEASRLRAGSDQRKLCFDRPFARYDHAD